jgi:hypothetical protein
LVVPGRQAIALSTAGEFSIMRINLNLVLTALLLTLVNPFARAVENNSGEPPLAFTERSKSVDEKGAPFVIDDGVQGGWFFPGTSGQGFLIDFLPGDPTQLFVAWFTFELESPAKIGDARQRWFVAQGEVVDADTATLSILSIAGGLFDQPGISGANPVGNMTIDFLNCREALVSYQFDSGGSGQIQILPLDPSELDCINSKNLSKIEVAKRTRWQSDHQKPVVGLTNEKGIGFNIDDSIEGGWFLPATSGQGFLMDYLPGTPDQLFVAWFTFEAESANKIGETEHRWFVGQGEILNGNAADMKILSVSNGLFNQPSAVVNNQVGDISVAFSSCREALVTYQFDDSGPGGQFPIQPLDPSRANCDQVALTGDAPDDCLASASRLFNGSLVSEEIKPVIDADFYRLVLDSQSNVRAFTQGSLNTVGRLHDSQCVTLTSDDDSGEGTNFDLSGLDLAAGTYFVSVRSTVTTATCPVGSALCKPDFDATGRYDLGIEIEPVGGMAQPDQFPDTCNVNDSPQLGDGESISGLINTADDLDFFRVDIVDNNSRLRAFSSLGMDVLGRIYDADCNQIAMDDNSGNGNNFDVSTTLSSGTYYVSVEAADGNTGEYTLNIEITPAMVAADDFPNTCDLVNSPLLVDDSLLPGVIEIPGDQDFFRVDIAVDRTELFATTTGDLDTVGRIYDAACTELVFNDDDEDQNFAVTRVVNAGTYFVSVEGFAEDTGSYNISVSIVPIVAGDDDFPNTCDLANTTLLASGTTTDGEIEVADDIDFFRFEVTEDTTIRTFTTFTDDELDTVGRVYDNACSEIESNDDAFGDQNFEIQTVVSAGTYYISVESFANSDDGTYQLTFEELAGGVGPNDDYPNTCDFDNSPQLTDGDMISGMIELDNDRDYFRIDIDVDDTQLRVFTTGDMDTRGRLFDADCEEIAENDDVFGTQNFEITDYLEPGTYYVSVEEFANSGTGSYDLHVEFLVDGVGANDDYPNTCDFDHSPVLTDGSMISGSIDILRDQDFFRVDVAANGTEIGATSDADFDSRGRIWDADCEEIAENDDDDTMNTLNFNVRAVVNAGTYYVSIESLGAEETGDYVVTLELIP